VIHAFQDKSDPKVLVAHPKTTGHGLELSAADTIVWFAPMHSVDLYEQANNRIMSGLQKRSMGVYHIGCSSLEWRIYKALKDGVSLQQEVLKLYDEEILGKSLTGELTSVRL
jgi:SNF2 family DNA or RNA helicase